LKVPKKIKVGGVLYTVRWPREVIVNDQYANAGIDHIEAVILIPKMFKGTNQGEKSFFHELNHAILEQINYQAGLGKKIDEDFVERFANCQHQVFIDNGIDFP
jgi:hypothetical protein